MYICVYRPKPVFNVLYIFRLVPVFNRYLYLEPVACISLTSVHISILKLVFHILLYSMLKLIFTILLYFSNTEACISHTFVFLHQSLY
jgi:hypothetical protein